MPMTSIWELGKGGTGGRILPSAAARSRPRCGWLHHLTAMKRYLSNSELIYRTYISYRQRLPGDP